MLEVGAQDWRVLCCQVYSPSPVQSSLVHFKSNDYDWVYRSIRGKDEVDGEVDGEVDSEVDGEDDGKDGGEYGGEDDGDGNDEVPVQTHINPKHPIQLIPTYTNLYHPIPMLTK